MVSQKKIDGKVIDNINCLSAFFDNSGDKAINDADKTLGGDALNLIAIHETYDFRHKRLLFTVFFEGIQLGIVKKWILYYITIHSQT